MSSNKKKEENENYRDWLLKEYLDIITKNYVPDAIKKYFIKNLTTKVTRHGILHILMTSRMYKQTFIDPVNYICTVFKITCIPKSISVNFAFLYSTDKKNSNKLKTSYMSKEGGTLDIIAYTISPALSSQDGEYRDRMTRFQQIDDIYKNYAKVFLHLEKYMINKIEKYDLQLEYEHFYPQIEFEKLSTQLDSAIINKRLMMNFLIYYWLSEVYAVKIGLQENHINPKFNQIIFTHIKEDLDEYHNICKKFGDDYIQLLIKTVRSVVYKDPNTGELELESNTLGQKLRPLNVNEVQNYLNPCYSPWREVYFSQFMTNLVANAICPSFPIYLDWFYIKNSRRGLFDNEQQIEKLEFSERALNIIRKLRESQHITLDPNKEFWNEDFQIISAKIDDPIEYAKTFVLMSNVTLGNVINNVGRTFNDLDILSKSQVWKQQLGGSEPLENSDMMIKFIWDLVYAICCMNAKYGMTHSDIHLNNITINNSMVQDVLPNSYEVYGFDDQSWFKFQKQTTYAYIIDFSRGTIKNSDEYFPFLSSTDQFNFHVDQRQRMIDKLVSLFPSFMNLHIKEVENIANNNYDLFYHYYTCVDLYEFSSKLLKRYEKLHPRVQKILKHISHLAEHKITHIMLLDNHTIKPDRDELPNITIAKECFIDYLISPNEPDFKPNEIIVNLWNININVEYTFTNWETFPPYAKNIKYIDAKTGKPKASKKYESMDTDRKIYEKYRLDQMKMIQYISMRHKEKYS
jgi:hypothetical protein